MDSEQWLTPAELAARWHLSKATVRQFRQSGALPALKLSANLFRFSLAEVLKFEQEAPASRSRTRSNAHKCPRIAFD
jgi:excisionase family DNA binding protein